MVTALTLPALAAPEEVQERLAAGRLFNAYEMVRGGFVIAIGPVTDCMALAEARDARTADYLVNALRAVHGQPPIVRTHLPGIAEGDEADGPCANEGHCCCCGPGDVCCDCGATMRDLPKEIAEERWRDFLDANPDDLTSPADLPNHALVTFEQFYAMARDIMPRVAVSPVVPG